MCLAGRLLWLVSTHKDLERTLRRRRPCWTGDVVATYPHGRAVGSGDYLLERLHEEVSRAARYGIPLACLLFRVRAPAEPDLATVDRLAHAASLLARRMVRDSDVVAALGSGCFGVLANTTDEGARKLADALAGVLRGFDFVQSGEHVDVDLAVGIACLGKGMAPAGLFEEARVALDRFLSMRPAEGNS